MSTAWDHSTYAERREMHRILAERGELDGLAIILCGDDCRNGQPPHVSSTYFETATPGERCPLCGAPAAIVELVPSRRHMP